MTAEAAPAPSSNEAASAQAALAQLAAELRTCIIGQDLLVERMLIALLCDGHLLVEGAPGLAKTTAVKALASRLEGDFHRVQFTPDLLPADLTGTEVYRPQDGSFVFQQGPLFHNIVLADEINRAPAKVQSALLEAMAERQVTVGRETYALPRLFMVMATQNPIEQEGTYPLPEAQLDRFLLYVRIGYPEVDAEQAILQLAREQATAAIGADAQEPEIVLSESLLFNARRAVLDLHVSEALEQYVVALVLATREPAAYVRGEGADLARWIAYGASPRATIGLERAARAHAWIAAKDYVSPDDVAAVAHDVLRHRVLLTFEAEAEGVSSDRVIEELLARVPVP
ncbi:MAG: AAA family ATPase [Gammaproteobacteria bacterium]